jgi:hypothetical protein
MICAVIEQTLHREINSCVLPRGHALEFVAAGPNPLRKAR